VALLYIDCDWYDSVMVSLNTFYDRVPVGGVIALDDFGYWEGARRALGEFIKQRDLEMPLLERYGPSIVWWIKGKEHTDYR
jgi:hypothetical protein